MWKVNGNLLYTYPNHLFSFWLACRSSQQSSKELRLTWYLFQGQGSRYLYLIMLVSLKFSRKCLQNVTVSSSIPQCSLFSLLIWLCFVSDAKTATWSFGVEDYGTLGKFFYTWKDWCSPCISVVNTLKKDCKYVDLSLIPRPVISLFQRLKQRKGPIPNPPSAGMDWSRVEAKLSSTLMQFQRDGVEYVYIKY